MKIKSFVISVVVMMLVSFGLLYLLSVLTYMYKWKADQALIGITVTYILAGFSGGITQRMLGGKEMSIGRKMLEGILLASIFVGILCSISFFYMDIPLQVSSRFLMIWMLLIGSICLGRIV